MARKQETLSDRLEMVRRSVVGAGERIRTELDRLEDLEQYFKDLPPELKPEVIAMYRLQILAIRQELDFFGRREEEA